MGPKNREELKDSLDEICDQLGLVDGQDDRCSKQFLPFVQKIFSLPYEPVPGEKIIEEAKKSMMNYFKCLSRAIECLAVSSLELFLLIPQCDIRKMLRDSRLHHYIETRLESYFGDVENHKISSNTVLPHVLSASFAFLQSGSAKADQTKIKLSKKLEM